MSDSKTLRDQIVDMAEMVASIKSKTRLSESSILRIVDMNLAIAQSYNSGFPRADETIEPSTDDTIIPFPQTEAPE